MKRYTDVMGKPLTKEDVTRTVKIILKSDDPQPFVLVRNMKIGFGKAVRLLSVLHHGNVITGPETSPRTVILKDETQAINAALRQLKKGRK